MEEIKHHYCEDCKGTTMGVDYCDNPDCPFMPCCGKSKDDCSCIESQIAELKTKLTGKLFDDMETQQAIYELKLKLNPEIAESPELDEDDDCLSCGA
jgi:hypothetical protein